MFNSLNDVEATNDVPTLIRDGLAAAESGDKTTARAALRKAVKLAPDSTDAWLGLAQVVGTQAERRQAYQRVLDLEPGNQVAQEGLNAKPPAPIQVAPTMTPPAPEAPIQATALETCYRHPNRETGLHCIQCERPICADCAHVTPVGYLCPECRKARRSPQYQVETPDAIKAALAGVVVGVVGGLLSLIVIRAGFLFYLFLFGGLGAALGEGVMRLITWATRKRGRVIQGAVLAGILVGVGLIALFLKPSTLPLIIFLVVIAITIGQRLK